MSVIACLQQQCGRAGNFRVKYCLLRPHLLLAGAVLLMIPCGQAQDPADAQRRCNTRFGDYSDFVKSHDFPYNVTSRRRDELLLACGHLSSGMDEPKLVKLMGNPDYIEPEDLNDVTKGGCRWTWVLSDPSPKGDEPNAKYRQIDVLMGSNNAIVEVNPKQVRCRNNGVKRSAPQ